MSVRTFVCAAGAACLALAVCAGGAWAGPGYHFFGSASYISPGENSNRAVQLVADAGAGTYSGVDFDVPAGLSIGNLNTLSTDYDFTAGDCGVGSPRFGITLSGSPNETIFVYIGPSPNYTNCPAGWNPSGNLLAGDSTVDATQLGGVFYEKWSDVQAQFAGQTVTDIFLVADYGADGTQTLNVDNTNVNGTAYGYEFGRASDCKNGGWQQFIFAPGPFANQGQCVSYFATQP